MLPISFNRDWLYRESNGNMMFDPRAAQVEYIPVTLPHDATIHEKRTPDAPGGTSKGYYPSKDYEYVKRLEVPAEWADKLVSLRFEGAYTNARVYVNSSFAGQCLHGYSEFTVALNDFLRFGQQNEIKVTLQSGEDSRWYAGTGLYRNVSLFVADPLHIAPDGLKLNTLSADETVAAIAAEVTLENDGVRARRVSVEIELTDAEGNLACRDAQTLNMRGLTREAIQPRLYVEKPRLWSPDAPNVYRVTARLVEDGQVTDEAVVGTFGIRVLTLDTVRGLAVNGQTVKLYGGCIHHDNGLIGAATIERAEARRIQLLREAGYNAIRSAHHPASRALLEACDRCGMMVMDELTDMWSTPKTRRDYSSAFDADWERALTAMVNKDYNHPSVVMYSMGNEIPDGGAAGAATYRKLARLTRALDGTRYITAGLNSLLALGSLGNPFGSQDKPEGSVNEMLTDAGSMMQKISLAPAVVEATNESYESMDICGYNYSTDRYVNDHGLYSNWISVGSETFPKDLAYNWKVVQTYSHVIGDFTWTSWDYLGEAGIGKDMFLKGERMGFGNSPYPWRIAWDADFDITGRRTPQGYYREIVVGHRSEPYVAMQDPKTYELEPFPASWSWPGTVSSWNWPGYEGKPIRVEVYGRGDEAELIVNGASLGRKAMLTDPQSIADEPAFRAVFDTVYQPGKVEAVVYSGGAEVGRCAVESADDAVCSEVVVDRTALRNDEKDLAYVDVWLKDAQGRLNNGASRKVSARVEGAGVLQGIGSGNPCSDEDFFDDHCQTFFGHAQAVVRPTAAGEITVTVEVEGCGAVVKKLTVGE